MRAERHDVARAVEIENIDHQIGAAKHAHRAVAVILDAVMAQFEPIVGRGPWPHGGDFGRAVGIDVGIGGHRGQILRRDGKEAQHPACAGHLDQAGAGGQDNHSGRRAAFHHIAARRNARHAIGEIDDAFIGIVAFKLGPGGKAGIDHHEIGAAHDPFSGRLRGCLGQVEPACRACLGKSHACCS